MAKRRKKKVKAKTWLRRWFPDLRPGTVISDLRPIQVPREERGTAASLVGLGWLRPTQPFRKGKAGMRIPKAKANIASFKLTMPGAMMLGWTAHEEERRKE